MVDLVSAKMLNKLFPQNKNTDNLAEALNKILPKYEINTTERVAAFLAQCGHESGGFSKFVENLNYSDKGLCLTFSKKFPTMDSAKPYHRQPEKIANYVYSNKNGNGSVESGDGWKFKGRGFIQLTGKANYSLFANSISKSLDETVVYCETLEGAIESACFFWKHNNLNSIADAKNVVSMTKAINGGNNGLQERINLYNEALKHLC